MIPQLKDVDSIIFDMDGTLWDATESYARVWNETCSQFGINTFFTGKELAPYMGMSIDDILIHLLGGNLPMDKKVFMDVLFKNESILMPKLGGILFSGVKEGLEMIHRHYRMFMLSNCSARGLKNFVLFTKTEMLFEGLLSQGERPASKSENLAYMIDRYSLKVPVYVGDTQADCDQAHLAGIPFVFTEYGFGKCYNADWQYNTPDSMFNAFLAAKCQ